MKYSPVTRRPTHFSLTSDGGGGHEWWCLSELKMFLHMACLLSLAVAIPSNAVTSPKPGCESTCGNLQVPYPFGVGIGSNCSMSSDFDIYCNTTYNPPKAYLPRAASPFEVVNISETKIYVKNWRQQQIVACYARKKLGRVCFVRNRLLC